MIVSELSLHTERGNNSWSLEYSHQIYAVGAGIFPPPILPISLLSICINSILNTIPSFSYTGYVFPPIEMWKKALWQCRKHWVYDFFMSNSQTTSIWQSYSFTNRVFVPDSIPCRNYPSFFQPGPMRQRAASDAGGITKLSQKLRNNWAEMKNRRRGSSSIPQVCLHFYLCQCVLAPTKLLMFNVLNFWGSIENRGYCN